MKLTNKEKTLSKELYYKIKNENSYLKDKDIAKKLGIAPQSLARAKKRWKKRENEAKLSKALSVIQQDVAEPVLIDKIEDLFEQLQRAIAKRKNKREELLEYLYIKSKEIIKNSPNNLETLQQISMLIKAIDA